MATERYLLHEMNDAEREAFEQHYFDCILCAANVRDEASIVAGLQRIKREGNLR
jgi:hypothetical protein